MADEYDATTAQRAYYPDRDTKQLHRLHVTEALLHDMAALGIVQFFEGAGDNPTGLTGYASDKLWLRVSAGVQATRGTVRKWDGVGNAALLASWPEMTPIDWGIVDSLYLTKAAANAVYLAGSGSTVAATAYAAGARLFVTPDTTTKLVCDPSDGDDIQAMSEWISGQGNGTEGTELYLEVADGMHSISTYIDIDDGRRLDMRGTATPDLIEITSISYSNDGEVGGLAGEVYTATIGLGAELPDQAVVGFAVGAQNIQGDNTADALNGGHIIDTIALDRLSITVKLRSHGVALTSPTTLDSTVTLGLTPNRLVVPKACLRVAEAGWDGAAREGFMNAMRGGIIELTNIGISYNGVAGDNDILFARDHGSRIQLRDYVVLAGCGEMSTRAFAGAQINAFRSCIGGSTMGTNLIQIAHDGTGTFTRCSMGSVSGDGLSASSGARIFLANSVLTGANQLARPTVPGSSIIITSSRLSHALNGVVPTEGLVSIDANSSIKHCTNAMSISGSNAGTVFGNPTFASNTNANPTPLEQSSTGGVWRQTNGRIYDPTFFKVGRFTSSLNFGSISAHSYEDLTIAATGVLPADNCLFSRSTMAAQNVFYEAFCNTADVITVRAHNLTAGSIDPAAFTAIVLVVRGS